MKGGRRYLLVVVASLVAILLFLLALTAANTPLFARHYPWVLALNALVAAALISLVVWQVRQLWREYREQHFGSRLKLRLMLMFALMALLPGSLIYGVSLQFVTKSIESWFDVRVEKALESGLSLGRSVLDFLLTDLTGKARSMALELSDRQDSLQRVMLNRLREQAGIQGAALFTANGQLVAASSAEVNGALKPLLPSIPQIKQARAARGYAAVEGEAGQDLTLRVLMPVAVMGLAEEPRVLQLTQVVPAAISANAESVQNVYRDYQELQLARTGLTRLYALTLTLTLLLSLAAAFALAFLFARRLSAPLSILAEGTQAVAAGDFSPRQAIYSRDELGVLTQSFNRMTRQLDEARRETDRHRSELESARAYLEEVLGNLSAGVFAFDRRFVLKAANTGAAGILHDELVGLLSEPIEAWPRQAALGRAIRDAFAAHGHEDWQQQQELERAGSAPQVLLLRGATLPDASGGGYVVVFDDVTELIAAQRSAAWGEVARRLAHEIKNPLTPIQLSAERLQHKLSSRLDDESAEFLGRSVQTIVNQVQAMKHMVDDFRDYARLPPPQLAPVDLNELIREVLDLYQGGRLAVTTHLAEPLARVSGDSNQLRQILHNLVKNAEDAQENQEQATLALVTTQTGRYVELVVADGGPGFPPEILGRAFEPYVTTKAKGTGLGLAIVKKIVDEHRGRIDLTNREPQGAQITLRLPLATLES